MAISSANASVEIPSADRSVDYQEDSYDGFGERLRQIENNLPSVEDSVRQDFITHSVLVVLYSIIIVVSLIGNTLVCRVLLGAKRSAYPTLNISSGTGTSKILIVNLAVR